MKKYIEINGLIKYIVGYANVDDIYISFGVFRVNAWDSKTDEPIEEDLERILGARITWESLIYLHFSEEVYCFDKDNMDELKTVLDFLYETASKELKEFYP